MYLTFSLSEIFASNSMLVKKSRFRLRQRFSNIESSLKSPSLVQWEVVP